MDALWVGIGGAVGAVLRFHCGGYVQRHWGGPFPYGTLTVNVVGSFLLGLLMVAGLRAPLPPKLMLALSTGVLGGFTTYSTFNYETLRLLNAGAVGSAVLNVLATVVLALLGGALGWMLGQSLT